MVQLTAQEVRRRLLGLPPAQTATAAQATQDSLNQASQQFAAPAQRGFQGQAQPINRPAAFNNVVNQANDQLQQFQREAAAPPPDPRSQAFVNQVRQAQQGLVNQINNRPAAFATQPPIQTTQPVGNRTNATLIRESSNTPNRAPAFTQQQFNNLSDTISGFNQRARQFNRASNLDLNRSANQGRLALASRSRRSVPFARGFQFGNRQQQGGRQPVFSPQDLSFRQRFLQSQNQILNNFGRRQPVFANRRQA